MNGYPNGANAHGPGDEGGSRGDFPPLAEIVANAEEKVEDLKRRPVGLTGSCVEQYLTNVDRQSV